MTVAVNSQEFLDQGQYDPTIRPYLYLVEDGPLPDVVESHLHLVEDVPPITLLETELPNIETIKAEFEEWCGSIALSDVHLEEEVDSTAEPQVSLLNCLKEAREGSAEADRMVEENVAAALSEAFFKAPHIREVKATIDHDGEIVQHGQTSKAIQYNSKVMRPDRHPVLEGITDIEGLNSFFITAALKAGLLKDNYIGVLSFVPGGVPEAELGSRGDGYFLEDLMGGAQFTTQNEDDEVIIENAFVEGVENGSELTFEERLARRHDLKAAAKVFEENGIDAPITVHGFLAAIVKIPKSRMPNGAVDFMRWYNQAADEVLGRTVERPEDYYVNLKELSRQREESIEDIRQIVKAELIAAVPNLKHEMDAIRLLWELAKKHGVDNAFVNNLIEPRVFGGSAAPFIIKGREQLRSGDIAGFSDSRMIAQNLAEVTGCGGGAQSQLEGLYGTDKYGSLAYICPKGCLNVRTPNHLDTHCPKCGVEVNCG